MIKFSEVLRKSYPIVIMTTRTRNPQIVIVGAGASGIAAATQLITKGFTNVLILESSDRVGGRIYTSQFADNIVDIGAQWCHGEENNCVFALANSLNLFGDTSYNFLHTTTFVDSAGRILPHHLTSRIHKAIFDIVGDHEALEKSTGSVGEYVMEKFAERQKTDLANTDPELQQMIIDWYQKVENSMEASDTWFEASGKGLAQYWECPGNHLLNWKDKGYKTILDILTKQIPDPSQAIKLDNKILFHKKVTNIEWKTPQVVVKCADGTKYKADHVILTVSLGVLKDNVHSLFTPKLPIYKQNAIEGLAIGTVDKLIFEFPYTWWNDKQMQFSFLWSNDDFDEFVKELDGTKESNLWLKDVFTFHKVDFQPRVLLGWVTGASARYMEKLPLKEVETKLMKLLRFFLGRAYQIPEPVNFTRSTWYSNENFRGSYSFRSMETERRNTSATELARPLYNDTILFAGEATHDHYFSTVHGAIETGWREADRLIKKYTLSSHL